MIMIFKMDIRTKDVKQSSNELKKFHFGDIDMTIQDSQRRNN